MPDGDEPLNEHPLVARASADDVAGPTVNIIGYLGRDPEEGYWRVYYSSKLETYVRVPEGDIVATFPRDADSRPMGRTVVTVRNPSGLRQVSPLPEQVQSGFLRGPVARNMASGGAGSATTPPPEAQLATTWPCVAVGTILLVTLDLTSNPPPPPTHPDTSMASCCLCWTPEATCPTP